MIQFKISTPGKVILHGEHAVVYGKTAVAASLDLRTTIEFAELSGKLTELEKIVELSFPKINLILSIPIWKIQDLFFNGNFNYRSGDHDLLYNQVQRFIITNCLTPQQKLSLDAFLYLLVCVSYEEQIDLKPCRLHLDTQLSVGAGLGSSASFAVCLAACFLHWSRSQKGILADFTAADLEKISRYAFNCEKIMHGTPSGIDNSVCTYGSIVEFRKGEPVNPVAGVPSMRILLVDTRVGRSTKLLVQRAMELRRKYPAIVNPILDSIDEISKDAFRVIGRIRDLYGGRDLTPILEEYKHLMTLVNMNQGLLCTLQVSHPSLDRICAEAQNYALAAKLTGAGGGGYAYILLPPDTQPETISSISRKLIADGFSVMLTNLGCGGVTIHK